MTHLDKGPTVTPSSSAIKVYHNIDNETGTQVYVTMHNPSNATTNDAFTFPVTTPTGKITVPQRARCASTDRTRRRCWPTTTSTANTWCTPHRN